MWCLSVLEQLALGVWTPEEFETWSCCLLAVRPRTSYLNSCRWPQFPLLLNGDSHYGFYLTEFLWILHELIFVKCLKQCLIQSKQCVCVYIMLPHLILYSHPTWLTEEEEISAKAYSSLRHVSWLLSALKNRDPGTVHQNEHFSTSLTTLWGVKLLWSSCCCY